VTRSQESNSSGRWIAGRWNTTQGLRNRQGTVESGVVATATGDKQRGDGRGRGEREGGEIAQLVHGLSDVGSADDVLPGALRLAEFKYQGAARRAGVGLITGQTPVEMEKAGQSVTLVFAAVNTMILVEGLPSAPVMAFPVAAWTRERTSARRYWNSATRAR